MTEEEIVKYLEDNEDSILQGIDNLMSNYVDDDWEDEFNDLYEAYWETGRGGAGIDVCNEIYRELNTNNDIDYNSFYEVFFRTIDTPRD